MSGSLRIRWNGCIDADISSLKELRLFCVLGLIFQFLFLVSAINLENKKTSVEDPHTLLLMCCICKYGRAISHETEYDHHYSGSGTFLEAVGSWLGLRSGSRR